MKKTIEALKAEIIKERIDLEAIAFEIYCKKELSRQMDHVNRTKKDWDSTVKRLNSLTIDKLREDFEGASAYSMSSPKQELLKQLEEDKRNGPEA